MTDLNIKISLLNENAKIPSKEHGDFAYDVYASEEIEIPAGQVKKIPLGFKTDFSSDWGCQVYDRSGLASLNIYVVGGVIDSSYRGEWMILLRNANLSRYIVKVGDRIGQIRFEKVFEPNFIESFEENLSGTERGEKGFGSSGK